VKEFLKSVDIGEVAGKMVKTHLVWPHQPENPPGRPGLGGSVHEEAHPCFPYLIQTSFKGIDVKG